MQVIVVVLLIIVAGVGAWFYKSSSSTSIETPTPITTPVGTTGTNEVNNVTPNTARTVYKNGTYTRTETYDSPGGPESMNISISLLNDKVTAATVTGAAANPTSAMYQEQFVNEFTPLVVGKPIDSIALTVVNGSSLTTRGFMDALTKIKAESHS